MRACRVWSAPYDGENPPPEEYQSSTLEESGRTRPQKTSRITRPQNQPHQSGPPVRDGAPGLLELEWDDSYDACPTQPHPEEAQDARPIPDEPPQHIQELRRTAIMLVKGSYIEESEFQNDVMVYDLVAQKDVQDSGKSYNAKPAQLESGELTSDQNPPEFDLLKKESSISNGLSMEDDTKKVGEPAQSDKLAIAEGEDLMAQYEELIRSLGAQSSSPANSELKSPTEHMEDEVEFNSFLPETPELERMPSSPFGTKPRSGSKGHAVPFTGQKTFLLPFLC